MSIWQLTDDDVEAVATRLQNGKSLSEVGAEMQISLEMAVCAMRQWPSVRAKRDWTGFNYFGL